VLTPRPKAGRGTFYKADFQIVLLFGMTELKAQIAWVEHVSGPCNEFIYPLMTTWFSRELRNGKWNTGSPLTALAYIYIVGPRQRLYMILIRWLNQENCVWFNFGFLSMPQTSGCYLYLCFGSWWRGIFLIFICTLSLILSGLAFLWYFFCLLCLEISFAFKLTCTFASFPRLYHLVCKILHWQLKLLLHV
jgi:hypothetical protein